MPAAGGVSGDSAYLPIGVWYQSSSNASKYAAIGINLYVSPAPNLTSTQLGQLKNAGISLICGQDANSLAFKDNPTIIGWLQKDEPDNAQWNSKTGTYDPPILPMAIQDRYRQMKTADPTRPVLLNLSQGVAWDGWYGRGTRTNHPEDYPEYVQGADIASFDIYPLATSDPAVNGQIWRVPFGVDRLRSWAGPDRPAWAFIETTNISGTGQATPDQTKAEVWLSLIHGAKGIVYFAHQISPTFVEAALLKDPTMAPAVAAVNQQVAALAPVINSRSLAPTTATDSGIGVDVSQKLYDGYRYIFSAPRYDGTAIESIAVPDLPAGTPVEVLGEGRSITVFATSLTDSFSSFSVHLYRYKVPTWTAPSSPSAEAFSNAAYWSAPPTAGSLVHLGSIPDSHTIIAVDRPVTVGGISFHNTNSYTVTGPGTVTLSAPYPTAPLRVEAGSHVICAPITFATPGSVSLAPGAALVLAGPVAGPLAALDIAQGAQLDIGQNLIGFDYGLTGTSPASVVSLVSSAFERGTWNGPGITSSAAVTDTNRVIAVAAADNADLGLASLDGQPITRDTILIKATLYGDTNLDGTIDSADLGRIAYGFTHGLAGWANGDFNYDGRIDGDDFALLDRSYALQDQVSVLVSVPEPNLAVSTLVAFLPLLRRRRPI